MATQARSNPGHSDSSRHWKVASCLGCGFLVIVAIPLGLSCLTEPTSGARRASPPRERQAGYVGSKACAPCHPGEFASHSRSGHARTLRPAARTPIAALLDG